MSNFCCIQKLTKNILVRPLLEVKLIYKTPKKIIWNIMGAPKTPKKTKWEYNGRASNKKGAGQIFFCP